MQDKDTVEKEAGFKLQSDGTRGQEEVDLGKEGDECKGKSRKVEGMNCQEDA